MRDPVEISRQLASDLLAIGAVQLSPEKPFTWASGMVSPIYCDNRRTISYPEIRSHITDGFTSVLDAQGLHPDVVAGTATAGIPHAAWLAARLNRPMVYVRSRPKSHGTGSSIEGVSEAGRSVVLIEDLVSTGGSSLQAVRALQHADMRVVAVLAIFTYGLPKADSAFEKAGVPLFTLLDLETLLEGAAVGGSLSSADLDVIRNWRNDPENWTPRNQHSSPQPS